MTTADEIRMRLDVADAWIKRNAPILFQPRKNNKEGNMPFEQNHGGHYDAGARMSEAIRRSPTTFDGIRPGDSIDQDNLGRASAPTKAFDPRDYEVLKGISVSDLIREGACDEAKVFLLNRMSQVGRIETTYRFKSLDTLKMAYAVDPGFIDWLITHEYIRLVDKEPQTNDVLEIHGEYYIVLPDKDVLVDYKETWSVTTASFYKMPKTEWLRLKNHGHLADLLKEEPF